MHLLLAWQLLADGVSNGSRIALMAVGFSLIYSVTKTLHVAHGAIVTVTAYLFWYLLGILHWPASLGFLVAAVLTVLIGVIHERALYRPIRDKNPTSFMLIIGSLGASIIMENALGIIFGFDTKDIRTPLLGSNPLVVPLGEVHIAGIDLANFILTVGILIALLIFLRTTKTGQRLVAVQDNPELASVIGINVRRVYLIAMALGTLISSPAVIMPATIGGLSVDIGFNVMLFALIIVFAGGVGSLLGTVLASYIVGILQALILLILPSQWALTFTFAILLIFIAIRPQGLIPKRA